LPIRPQHKWLYPFDWPELSRVIRFERAKSRCEACARPHGKLVRHLGDGRWWDEDARTWRDGRGRVTLTNVSVEDPDVRATKVTLATCHLDHDPTNNRPRNLKALCQRCHMLHDKPEHLRRRAVTYRLRWALGDLFLGPYPTS
jgi:hypothetical protein